MRAPRYVTAKYTPYTARNAPAQASAIEVMSRCPNTATTSVTTTSAHAECATANSSGNRKYTSTCTNSAPSIMRSGAPSLRSRP